MQISYLEKAVKKGVLTPSTSTRLGRPKSVLKLPNTYKKVHLNYQYSFYRFI